MDVTFEQAVAYLPCVCAYPPASEASREVANLTWRKNQHSPVCGVIGIQTTVLALDYVHYSFNGHNFTISEYLTTNNSLIIVWLVLLY